MQDGSSVGASGFFLLKRRFSSHSADLGVPTLVFCLFKAPTDNFNCKTELNGKEIKGVLVLGLINSKQTGETDSVES